MIDTVALKTKVLKLAFQGKLTEQTDENARELFKSVCDERDSLIKQKVIKKNKTKAITSDDITFRIPSNWIWVRLGDVINLQSGQDLTTSDYNDNLLGVPYITGASNFRADESLIINRWTEMPKAIALENDILLSVKGTVGKLAFLNEKKGHIARQIMGIRPIGLDRKYVKYFVQEQVEELKAISKGLIPGIERDNVLNMLMPLAPLNEQEIIVEKIEEAIKNLEIIDALQQKYSSDLEVLKSKIIDAGIQGKLTEQLPEDGTAEELLKQIAEEKKLLIKEKKIKATKALPEITEDEMPFEIPDNWKWVRLSEIMDVRDGTHDSPKYVEDGIPLVTSKNISSGGLDFTNVNYISQDDANKINERSNVDTGDILFAMIGTIGNPVIVEKDREFCIKNVALFKNFAKDKLDIRYVYWMLMREQYVMKKKAIGGLQPFISLKVFREYPVPLPPIAEQRRIADKLDDVISMC